MAIGDDGRVEAVSQTVQACAFGQASAALLARGAVGRGRTEIDQALVALEQWLGGGDLADWPGIEALSPARERIARRGAILLPFRALLAALDDAR